MDFTNLSKYVKGCFRFKGFVFDGLHDMPEGIDVYLKRTRKTGNCPECQTPMKRLLGRANELYEEQ